MKQLILSVLMMSIFSLSLSAGEPLKVGDKAPEVKVKNHLGKTVNTGKLFEKGPSLVAVPNKPAISATTGTT